MATTTHIRIGATAVLAAVVAAALAVSVRPAAAQGRQCTSGRGLLAASTPSTLNVSLTKGPSETLRPAYNWPVKPFGRQHPVRGFLNDPRIGGHGSRAFHFGIDVAAADGTPVYAVE